MTEILLSESMPVMALRGMNVFPGSMVHFDVGRPKSIRALEEALNGKQEIFLVAQTDLMESDPGWKQLHKIGTIAEVRQVLKMPGETMRVLVEGKIRGTITDMIQTDPYLLGRVETVPDQEYDASDPRVEALIRQSYSLFEQYTELSSKPSPEHFLQVLASTDPSFIADFITQHMHLRSGDTQKVLDELDPVARLEMVNQNLASETQILKMENELNEKVQESVNQNQRDYYLREQLKVIHNELGDYDEDEEVEDYEAKVRKLKLPEEIEQKLLKEVSRLSKQPSGSSEAAVLRNYLDICLELPWNTRTKETVDVEKCRKMLDADHYGLEKVKERILELLAVKKLAPDLKGQIICLVGPPGVGKTSIAMSIAKSLNRKLARVALGGIHDEADIRGHRKTYIGAMPGRIISAISQAGSRNPVMLLDEIDKLGSDYRGDPSSALLEALDAEQNSNFRDHYLEIPFDLSECMFITTANTTSTIPAPLLDRMEVIELSSYTDEEKLHIAKDHLLPKQIARHGLKKSQLRITDAAMREIIACYTRESGVRNLERQLAKACRRAAKKFATGETDKRITITGGNLEEYLGVRLYQSDELAAADQVGVVTGLAWTSVGGETLEVEVNVMDGSGKLELTGNLGNVMKESAQAAMSYIRSRASVLNLPEDFYKTKDIHVHFPEGAVPKDGPSAGITVCTAMVSALTGAPVRRDIAMTGEISIRGRVLPIGGLKEKTMAALRHGIKTVIIPEKNEKDLEEIDQTVRRSLNFITVSNADAVLSTALDFSKCPNKERVEEPIPELLPTKKAKKSSKTEIRQ